MPTCKKSFRIGCGRYLQEPGILSQCGAEILRLGKAPLVIGGHTALEKTRAKIEPGISAVCEHYKIIEYTGTCNDIWAKKFAALAQEESYDVIVGVGGGVIMDFAKLCGYFAHLPVINVPTSSATCAAYTPQSVCYTVDGRTDYTRHYDHELGAVLADTDIIGAQPIRLLLSGVFDALAKFVEIKHRFHEQATVFPLGLDWAYHMADYSYQYLTEHIEQCITDMNAGLVSNTVNRMIFTSIAATGMISNITRGAGQSALAHEFYEKTRILYPLSSKPYLHGEVVGVGLLLQNFTNNEVDKNEALLALMQKYNMPRNVSAVGAEVSEESLNNYYTKIRESAPVREKGEEGDQQLLAGLEYLFSL